MIHEVDETLRGIVRTKNRFDRQVAVCEGLGLRFGSLGDLLSGRAFDRPR